MRIALLEPDAEQIALATEACGLPACQLQVAYGAEEYAKQLGQFHCPIHPVESWQSLLDTAENDVVFVGGSTATEQRAEQLRRLAQAGTDLLVSVPVGDMVLGFELQMIQRDTGALIQPFFPGICHPLFDELETWVADQSRSPIGHIEQLEFERRLPADGGPMLSAFARDAVLLRRLMVRIMRIGAMQPDAKRLSIHMTGERDTLGQWTCRRTEGGGGATLQIHGADGSAQVDLNGGPAEWSGQITKPKIEDIPGQWAGHTPLLERLAERSAHRQAINDEWDHACRAVELAEAAERSCKKGRHVDLFHEEHSEEATFKSIMAAGGCFLLLTVLGAILVLGALEPISPWLKRIPGWRNLPWVLLLAGLAVFLSLQLLKLLFQREARQPEQLADD